MAHEGIAIGLITNLACHSGVNVSPELGSP